MKERLGKNTKKKKNSFGVFIFPIFKYRKKKFKESLKLVPVKKIECEIPPFFVDLCMEFYIHLHFVTDGVLGFLFFFFLNRYSWILIWWKVPLSYLSLPLIFQLPTYAENGPAEYRTRCADAIHKLLHAEVDERVWNSNWYWW